MSDSRLNAVPENLEEMLTDIFHDLHKHPELSHQEYETTKKITKILEDAGIEVLNTGLHTGLVAQVTGKEDGPVTAVRCDIDGLPICEETDLSYKSETEGRMHACGHDFHTALMIGAAIITKSREDKLKGKVKFVFEAGEENGDGAVKVLETGVLDDVEAMFGVHCFPDAPVGMIGVKEGAMTAAVDKFAINIEGVGAHAARPEKARDAVIVATNIVNMLQTIVSRNISPLKNALLSITHIQAGNTWNVLPENAYIEGTARTLDAESRKLIPERVKIISQGVAQIYGAEAELVWEGGSKMTDNTKEWALYAAKLGKKLGLKPEPTTMGLEGEDFAYYQEKIPGAFIIVGTGLSRPHHHPQFKVDEKALYKTAQYFAALAEGALEEMAEKRIDIPRKDKK